MPISAEQWRASVGAVNASRRPCQSNKRWMCWEVFLLLLTALLVSTLLPGGGWRGTGSRKGMSRGRGGGGSGGELAPSLLIAPRRRFVLVISGDIETNPGPITQYGWLYESDLDVLLEELSPVNSKWKELDISLHIDEVEASHPSDSLREVLQRWLTRGNPWPWHEVLRALRSVGEGHLASELKVKYGLLEESDLDMVASELDTVSSKWYTLGQELLPTYCHKDLDSISTQHPQNPKTGLIQMLRERMDFRITWNDIFACLRSSGDSQLADHLETKYCSSLLHESHLDVVVSELATMSGKWESLGKQFGIPSHYLDDIRTQYPNPADCMKELIKVWLQQDYHIPSSFRGLLTWSHVVLALKSPQVGESQLGEHLKQKYLPAAAAGGAHKILEEALKKGYVDCHIWKVLVTGVAGSGKTTLKYRLFGEEPPSIHSSTGLAEAAIRAISRVIVGTDLTGWFRVTYDQLMEMLSGALKAGIPMEETKASSFDTHEAVVRRQLPKMDARNSPETPKTRVDPGKFSKASQTPTASTLTPTAPTAKQVSSSKQELVRLVERSKGSKRFLELHWIHFIDSGGQPQFHEVLPTFIRNTTATMFVMKLCERLDEHPTIEYYDGNGQLCGKPYHYALRNDQMLLHCIRTLLSQPSTREGKHSKVFFVGTHRDLEDSSSETRTEKNRKLIDMLKPSLQDQLVYYRPFSEVIFPVNAKNPVELDDEVFAMIRKLVEDKRSAPPPYKVPVGWFLLEQDITKSAKRGVISRRECQTIATILNIDEEALTAALEYFDKLNIFLYYPSVLPEVVFSSPQVLPDKVTEFVHFSYCLQSDSPPVALEGVWLQFKEKGIVTVDMFQDERFSAHYIPGLFTPTDLIKLFKHLLIIAPLSSTEYFMPSLLQTISPEEVRKQLPPPSTSVVPLLVHFPAGCAQNGVFCALVVYLLSECHWKIACGPTGTPLSVSCSCIRFQLPDKPVCVTIVDSFAYLEVHVQAPETKYAKFCPVIQKAIFSGLKAAADVLKYNNSTPVPAFLCKCSSPPHTATPSIDDEDCYLMCTKSTSYAPLTEQHAIWLDCLQPLAAEAVTLQREPVSSPLTSSMLLKSASPRKETDGPKKEEIHSPSSPPTPQASTDDTLAAGLQREVFSPLASSTLPTYSSPRRGADGEEIQSLPFLSTPQASTDDTLAASLQREVFSSPPASSTLPSYSSPRKGTVRRGPGYDGAPHPKWPRQHTEEVMANAPKKEEIHFPSSPPTPQASTDDTLDVPKRKAIHSPSSPPTPQASTDDTLVNEDFLDITEYLLDMEKTDVYNLGLVLGLSQHKLKANIDSKSFLDDVISAWLRKEDQVIKRGEPSWAVLIRALKHRRVSQTGIASNIAKDKGLLLQ